MALYPPELRNLGSEITNTLLSEHVVLRYYDDLVMDSVYFFHNQSFVWYQNFTSNLNVNMQPINFVDLRIYGLEFVKEKFLVIYGELRPMSTSVQLRPYTLIKYYTSE